MTRRDFAQRAFEAANKHRVHTRSANESPDNCVACRDELTPSRAEDCTCFYDCGVDSASGHWHQHESAPCPVHPDAEVIG